MWFRNSLPSLSHPSTRRAARQSERAAERRRQDRRLLFEGLEQRHLMAFDVAVNYPVGTSPQAIVAADLNNDAIQDIAVANNGSSNVSVLLGNGDGTFDPAVNSPTGANPLSLAVGDLDGDGILDLVTANSGGVSVLFGADDGTGKGTGSFGSPTSIGVGSDVTSVAVGDFNDDGLLDLGVTSNIYHPGGSYCGWYSCYYYYYGYYEGQASVLVGDGNGNFTGPNSSSLGYGYFTSAIAANLNGAGADEFVAVNTYYGYAYGAAVIMADGGTDFLQYSTTLYTGADAVSVTAGDVNGDYALDLVTANAWYNSVSVFLNDGSGGFGAAQTYTVGSYSNSVAIGDFNHDSQPDIAAANVSSGDLSVLYGRASGGFSPAVSVAPGLGAYALAAGDFDGDTWPDLAALANSAVNNVAVLLNNQDWPPAPASLSIGDATVTEGDSGTVEAVFTVTREDNLTSTVTVNYSTAGGNAAAGTDYVAAPAGAMLTFGPGETSKTITIVINGDAIDEYDESFYVNLSSPNGAIINDSQGEGKIVDNDLPPEISINDVTMNERNHRQTTTFAFTVSLSQVSGKTVYVNYATEDGTATVDGGDYLASNSTATIAPGETSTTIWITVRGDKGRESNESFFVNLTGPTNGTIGDGRGIGTIVNDDGGKGGKGKPPRATTTDLVLALLAEDDLTATRKRK